MELKPIKRYVPPRYPTHDVLLEHPEILRFVPKRWRGNKLVLATLGAAAMLLVSCRHQSLSVREHPVDAPYVAPIFLHGEGRGGFGCVAVNPPVLLSEDEAFQVIRDEAKRTGIRFVRNGCTLSNVNVPCSTRFQGWLEPETFVESPAGTTPTTPDSIRYAYQYQIGELRDLVLDGYDSTLRIAIEFISLEDYRAWKQPKPPKSYELTSSFNIIDICSTAVKFQNATNNDSLHTTLGVFYDPMCRDSWGERDGTRWAREASKEDLRLQVRDFIAWLKAQGII